MTLLYLLLGSVFGFILSRSGAADYDFIQGMFLLTEFQLYGIIAVAVIVAAPGIWLIKRRGRTIFGRKVEIELKPLHRGNVVGGALFGSFYPLVQRTFGLPPLKIGTGEG